jgi:hypothetical protein
VRVLALAFIVAPALVVASVGGARADDDDDGDVDGEFKPFPRLGLAGGVTVRASRLGGQPETGVGLTFELAAGRGRWQYFVEGSGSTSRVSTSTVDPNATIGGNVWSGGLGVRWLARQFRFNSAAGFELLLLSRAGYQRYSLDDNTRLGRPELAFGFGIQGRKYKRPRLAFRIDMRVLFTPNDAEDMLASCRGRCMNEVGSSTGFSTGIGFAW